MEGFFFKKLISNGSTSVVKEYTNSDGTRFAVKRISRGKIREKDVMKEITIHKQIEHKNIVAFIDFKSTENDFFLILQFVPSELFLFLETHKGLHHKIVHFFFVQLLNAVEYLHSKNICHRDIKPENILLSDDGNLLLCDFGSATAYKYKGIYRNLTSVKGTLPYIAPEVHQKSYYGDKADVWSIGILLFVMSTGSLPWKKGTPDDEDFMNFFSMNNHFYEPFSNCDTNVLKFFKTICNVNQEKRPRLREIRQYQFVQQKNEFFDENQMCIDPKKLFKLFDTNKEVILPFSQPNTRLFSLQSSKFICSQPNFADETSLRRVYTLNEEEKIMTQLISVLNEYNVDFKRKLYALFFNTIDTQRNDLIGEFAIQKMNDGCVISINRLKGSILEFKNFCNLILSHIEI